MTQEFVPIIMTLYALIAGFTVGWLLPRGKRLKALQLRTLKRLHNFFADEEEYIQHKAERIKRSIKRKVKGK